MKNFDLHYFKFYTINGNLVAMYRVCFDNHIIHLDGSYEVAKKDTYELMLPVENVTEHEQFSEEFLKLVKQVDSECWKAAGASI